MCVAFCSNLKVIFTCQVIQMKLVLSGNYVVFKIADTYASQRNNTCKSYYKYSFPLKEMS